MHPELFEVLGYSVASYGFLLALSLLIGTGLAIRQAKKAGLNAEAILDLAILICIGAGIGARFYYVVLHWEEFQGNLGAILPLPGSGQAAGGLVYYGGLLGGLAAALLYLRLKRYPIPAYLDTFAPSIALGLGLTRIGCFLNGCCYGKEGAGPLSVGFPPSSAAGEYQEQIQAAGLLPSQLYESAGAFMLFLVLLSLSGRWRRREGALFSVFVVAYGALRFLVDFTRHYESAESIVGLSHNQGLSLLLALVFIPVAVRSFRKGAVED